MESSLERKEEFPPIPQVKTVMVINNFIANTTTFLNLFAQTCETKLARVSRRLTDVELTVSLLEAKLDSVPGLADVATKPAEPAPAIEPEPAPQEEEEEEEEEAVPSDDEVAPAVAVDDGLIPLRTHPDYEPYFRLQKLGVPEPQIRLKMQAEGVDPDAISDPDRLVPRPDDSAAAAAA